jgi:hypothetical protein
VFSYLTNFHFQPKGQKFPLVIAILFHMLEMEEQGVGAPGLKCDEMNSLSEPDPHIEVNSLQAACLEGIAGIVVEIFTRKFGMGNHFAAYSVPRHAAMGAPCAPS